MTGIATGTVTFLFTDIEGSTKRWEQHRSAMSAALVRHDALLREAIEAHGGYVFKTIGDAFCAAFPTAQQALQAALAAQHTLHMEEWGDPGPLLVRMALHTGEAEERAGDYFGPPVNRVARILSAGHGGQVLLSLASSELVRSALPEGVSLRDMGEHHLKDLAQPERVFQVIAEGLPTEFPALKTLDARPNNLPLQRVPIIGREKEVVAAREILLRENVPLLTLTGPGGTGKTRLALHMAAGLIEEMEDGVFFVNLAPITDPSLVPSTIAQALGVKESGGRALLDTLKDYLREKRMLLVLDNFEQVLSAAPVVYELLQTAPKLKILATSRAKLNMYGEHEYAVPPLQLPRRKPPPTPEQLTQYEAVRLFIERAVAARSDFAVNNDNAPAIAEICHRLDGLPLAIELAAARVKILAPQALLARLEDRLKLLTGGAQTLPARQQTLRGAIEWSHDLLDEGEKVLLRRLSVFVGGRTFEAIEAICNAEGDLPVDVLDGVESLVSKSLLRQEEEHERQRGAGEPRFVMLETIHEYAREKLEESGEAEETRRRHAEFFLEFAEQAELQIRTDKQDLLVQQLAAEHDNLRASMRWAEEHGEIEIALRMAGALYFFWTVRGFFIEGRDRLARLLAYPEATSHTTGRARALYCMGYMTYFLGDYESSRSYHEEGLTIARELGDKQLIKLTLSALGGILANLGQYDIARKYWEEILPVLREERNKWGVANALAVLGDMARAQGDLQAAARYNQEAVEVARETGTSWLLVMTTCNIGNVTLSLGEPENARALFTESLGLALEIEDLRWASYGLDGLAGVAGASGLPLVAARLFSAAEALRQSLGAAIEFADKMDRDRNLAAARDQLTFEEWQAAWAEGQSMSFEQAIELALQPLPGPE